MNDIETDRKISCLLFNCPMVEEVNSCHLSNLRMITSKQRIVIDEKIERKGIHAILSPKFLCLKHKAELK
jgi:hypothetical protein